MNCILLVIKGFIIGIAKIIPGVSGAMLAMSMGIYEKAMNAISHFFENAVDNFKFLFPLGIGAVLAVILASKLVVTCLNSYYLPTMLLFIGLIIGGIPMLYKKINIKKMKVKHVLAFIISFLCVFILTFIGKQNIFLNLDTIFSKIISYFIIGMIDAITMIIPGISGTAVMMILGCYNLLLTMLSSLNSFTTIMLFIPFIIGVVVGIILLAKLLTYLFSKHQQFIYSSILGFAFSSVVFLFLDVFNQQFNILQLLIGLILFIIGILISYKLEKN